MKKVLKIVGIFIGSLAVLLIAGIAFIIYKFATVDPEIMAPENYETTLDTEGVFEKQYLSHGTHEVSYFEEDTDEAWRKYEIYYPSDLENSSEKYPVIVMSNGSGVRASRYTAIFQHYASWGFIVIGNEEDTAYAGTASDASISYLISANSDSSSALYQKVDLDNIGIIGHSQGGVGVFNAITAQSHGDMYKAAVSLSPVPEESAKTINWTYDPTKISIPIMLLAGTNKDCISIEQLQTLYSHISSDKAMAIRSNTNHPEMLYSADGYVTAWMMWHLQGDEEAAQAFIGKESEFLENNTYQNQEVDCEAITE